MKHKFSTWKWSEIIIDTLLKTGGREKFKDLENLIKFQFKENQKAFAFLPLRPSKIKAKDSFT